MTIEEIEASDTYSCNKPKHSKILSQINKKPHTNILFTSVLLPKAPYLDLNKKNNKGHWRQYKIKSKETKQATEPDSTKPAEMMEFLDQEFTTIMMNVLKFLME